MQFNSLAKFAALALVTAFVILTAGCRKNDNTQSSNRITPTFTPMPDSAMFITTLDSTGKSIYVVNAVNGKVLTRYHYPYQSSGSWCYPAAGNDLLYNLGNDGITAIDLNTGAVRWTDTLANQVVPVLHAQTFYGVTQDGNGAYTVYALDATKPAKTFLWKYPLSRLPADLRYDNGMLYIKLDQNHLTALNAQTGDLKWNISRGPYELIALTNGLIIADNSLIDAISGTQIGTVAMPLIPPSYGAQTFERSSLDYATKDVNLISTEHLNSENHLGTRFISATDRRSGANLWQYQYDGGFSTSWGIFNYIEQSWNKTLLIKNESNQSSKYGTVTTESHWLLDLNSGGVKLQLADTSNAHTTASYISGNTLYLNKRFESTLVGLPPGYSGYDARPADYILAVDLVSGKQKWNINKTLAGYTGTVASCVLVGKQGFSPYIQ